MVEIFERVGPDLLRRLTEADVWAEVLAVEPQPVRCIPWRQLGDVAGAFADMVDLLTPFTLGHSAGVAELAGAAAAYLRLPDGTVDLVRRAALLHDLGRVTVSSHVWEKPGTLTATQQEGEPFAPPQWRQALTERLDMPRDGVWPCADLLKGD